MTGSEQPLAEPLDAFDERIVWELARNSRVTNKYLSEVLGIAQSTCLTRIRNLHKRGVLRSHHAHPDWGLLGLPLQAMVAVRLKAQARKEVSTYARRVIRLPNVLDVFQVGGSEDFLVHVACTSSHQLRRFIAEELSMDDAVASTQTNLVFEHLNGLEHMNETGSWVHMEVVPAYMRAK
ncbi:Lrp/AsnC family transcriptional regulator [Aeromicrobium sp. 9AM]|uniref:Lrp/AsnC family transcriptional regulator n=1 Tax=Aeromicrobium sp. 9AM TaxID=2653126 RepID=UPI00191685F2|nr:Lrp/AsnC family transcriptional regulator [Aeromicrobium sp. 9AM]